MKTILSILALLTCTVFGQVAPPLTSVPGSPPTSIQHSVTLAWDRNDPSEGVTGYRIYWGTSTGTHNNKVEVGDAATATIALPARADYFFVATAYNPAGESLTSDELNVKAASVNGPPSKPAKPTIKVTVQTSSNLKSWADTYVYNIPAKEDEAFFRAKVEVTP